jgi:tRNA pseudouridine32 synthase/23S rRNA pseudouridine746 synthase
VAFAEFWWGAPPPGGARVEGVAYPACREKCGAVLPFLLRGLAVAPRRSFRPRPATNAGLVVRHEDERFLVLEKPEGLLTVPARDEAVRDSLVARVRSGFPLATGPIAVHRLDLDTSGLVLVAHDLETYQRLQRQFLERSISKRYLAVLEGRLEADRGEITLPLRVDLEQRPRQLVDPVHGRPALTRYEVLGREGSRTRLYFFPVTGRTHQLRVHAAHPSGLGMPIVGDRLYGHPGPRLLLHAERLTFRHPWTGTPLTVSAAAPF